jgi:hypothetical protein
MHFLLRCEREGAARLGTRLASEKPISRSLLAPIFPDREFKLGGHIVTLLKGTMMEQLAGVLSKPYRRYKQPRRHAVNQTP